MTHPPRYSVSKTFGQDLGLSCAFRQHAAESHCRHMHGYALEFTLVVGSELLDQNGWCFDFGAFKEVKLFLQTHFDHTTVVALDDPHLRVFERMEQLDLISLVQMPRVGCEAFARFVYDIVHPMVAAVSIGRAWLVSVTVREHGANAVTFEPHDLDSLPTA